MKEKPILAAVSVALRRGEKLLLIRRGRAPSRGLYAFPGGRVEAGEELEAAARRELTEETGLEAGGLAPFARFHVEGDASDYDLQVFAGGYVAGEPIAADDAEWAGFFTLDELERLDMPPTVRQVARQILALPAADISED